jgi:cyclopropane fatty-acyl-phospholipid synthase-like methyltransferase
MIKPFSQACENNGPHILNQLSRLLSTSKNVLEIGSGTGQHAVYFAKALDHLIWQTSDLEENHEGIKLWLDESGLENVPSPITIDVTNYSENTSQYDAIFMANTLHIMSSSAVESCLKQVAMKLLNSEGLLIVYGPFNYDGEYTSESNARFDQWLKAADEERGIREFEWVNKMAGEAGFTFIEDNPMPANNRLLVWRY